MEYGTPLPFGESRKLKQFGGILFGIILGLGVTDSILRGATYVFPNEEELWSLAFWGDHYFLRITASCLGTLFGSFAAGCIAKFRGRLCGVLSALPTSIFWPSMVIVYFACQPDVARMSFGQWIVIALLTALSPTIGFYGGGLGASVRNSNPQLFESRRNTVLGVKWFHWLWLMTVIGWTGALATYSIYQGLWLLFGLRLSSSLFNVALGLVGILIFLSIFYLFTGLYKTFFLLISGYREGISRGRIALRILGWTIGIWLIVGVLQWVANLIFVKY